MYQFKRKKHWSTKNIIWAQPKSAAHLLCSFQSPSQTCLHLIQSKQDYTQGQQMNLQEEKKLTKQAERMRIFYARTGLNVNDVCWLFAFVQKQLWVADLWPSVSAIIPPATLNRVFKRSLINLYLKKVQMSCDVGCCACANSDKANKTTVGPQMLTARMRKRMQTLPVLRRPTAVGNSGEYRLIITIKQPDTGARSRLLGLEAPPGLERGWLEEFQMEIWVFFQL